MTEEQRKIQEEIQEYVKKSYGRIADQGTSGSCCGPSSGCCGGGSPTAAAEVAATVGYDAEDLASLPEGANMGLSCGNPVALASLEQGEVVLDLGSGAGFDVFIAGVKVGRSGRAIGVDMTPEMVARAREAIPTYGEKSGLDNVEFREGEIEQLPLEDESVDIVISNCVINLSRNKEQVWREIARVLKPGGRVAISDLALLQPLPEAVRTSMEALVGCVAGAVLVEKTKEMVRDAGLVDARFEEHSGYIESMSDWSDPVYRELASSLPQGASPADYVTSLAIAARKPR